MHDAYCNVSFRDNTKQSALMTFHNVVVDDFALLIPKMSGNSVFPISVPDVVSIICTLHLHSG
jgi:hypothetical protein